MTPKHSPTPFESDDSHDEDYEGLTIWSGDVIVAHVVADQHGQQKENAAFIVQACNAHEALVLVARMATQSSAHQSEIWVEEFRKRCEAALKLAGEV